MITYADNDTYQHLDYNRPRTSSDDVRIVHQALVSKSWFY